MSGLEMASKKQHDKYYQFITIKWKTKQNVST